MRLEQARFHLPALLPPSVRTVLYLDVDTLVRADPAPGGRLSRADIHSLHDSLSVSAVSHALALAAAAAAAAASLAAAAAAALSAAPSQPGMPSADTAVQTVAASSCASDGMPRVEGVSVSVSVFVTVFVSVSVSVWAWVLG